MEDIREIIKSLEDSRILLKSVSEANKKEMKEGKNGFIGMLLAMPVLLYQEICQLVNDKYIQAGE